MANNEHEAPNFHSDAFNCPLCNAYAHQKWSQAGHTSQSGIRSIPGLSFSTCEHCEGISHWIGDQMIYPHIVTAPLAHPDMPKSVSEFYNEAREVSSASPRAAAALLRLAAKKICEHHGVEDDNLNRSIGKLKAMGLPKGVINSLDVVRIVGNEGGAHEGQIDLSGKDNKEIVDKLFWLINFIVEKTISDPGEVEEFYKSMPESKKEAVQKRDEHEESS